MSTASPGRLLRTLTLLAACTLVSAAAADDIDVSKVPANVRKVADEAVKKHTALKAVKWTGADKYIEGKVIKYDLEGEDEGEYGVTVTVTVAGAIEELREQTDFKKLPPAVTRAVLAAVPGFKDDEVYKVASGKNLATGSYELEGTDAKGRYVWLDSSPAGKIDELYTEVAWADVPKAVQDALKKRFPAFQATTHYAVQEGGKLARYDIDCRRGKGGNASVSFTPAGKFLEVHAH
jgi:hypothetical protein